MDHLRRYERTLTLITLVAIGLPGFFGMMLLALMVEFTQLDLLLVLVLSVAFYCLLVGLSFALVMPVITRAVTVLWQAIWYISPDKNAVPAPQLQQLKLGRELISAMVMQVYELASNKLPAATDETPATMKLASETFDQLPLPTFVLNKDRQIVTANAAASTYLERDRPTMLGKSIYDVLRMSFTSDDTFDAWLEGVTTSRATATKSWEHVRLTIDDKKATKQFDLAAAFSKDDTAGNEVIVMLFDRTASYDKSDQATSYVALAVHELRTPLTVLRGYIEVFEDELGDNLTPEHKDFMRKMSAAAQSLTAFVSNILNVARVDQNQMVLSLHEADWSEVLSGIIKDLELRASVRGKEIELTIAPDLPSVGIDKISMYEVVSNLVDNAIKYSAQSHKIVVSSYKAQDGTIATEIQDFGPGMPESVVADLFTKFYRSHRSKNSVGGSGLGLYLVKSIVTAHGGNVWVNSHEGEGSKFGFSLQTYETIKASTASPKDGIERQANGWIKNHSMYRR
jgi:signal transduction histidine kinase